MPSKPSHRRGKTRRTGKVVRRKPIRNNAPAKPLLATKSSRLKVRAFRDRMRAKGMRLIQIWLPDTRTEEFSAEARRQSLLANRSLFATEDQNWVDSMADRKRR
jgi:hypothetical protein